MVLFLALWIASPVTAGSAVTGLPSHAQITAALEKACAKGVNNGSIFSPCEMWVGVVRLDGTVAVVAKNGHDPWKGSRVIAMQKANTGRLFSKDRGLALSTANLFSAVQPGGSLFGLQFSNPIDTHTAYRGPATQYGTLTDPAVGRRVGGVNVFGGGLALYDAKGRIIGGLGVSGDSPCADHNIAWRIRHALGLDHVPAGVNKAGYGGAVAPVTGDDNIIYGPGGFSHAECGFGEKTVTDLPAVSPVPTATAMK
ncbi:MAG: heme-binding protein [bacterium]|nr:heme-binding protein [bacterium]MDZ4299994.1 heme-binding protein [Candidatus Sungbacteria bacterium]